MTADKGTGRQAYLDRARGIAVVVMIWVHVLDAWTLLSDRQRPGFGYAILIGGFAAPLFLFLAGVGAVLSAGSKFRKTGDLERAWKAVLTRGWQIFGLAFLFRLQSYVLTGGYNPASLLKVDILNVMGPALVVTGAVGAMTGSDRRKRILAFACLAVGVAMSTPLVRTTALLSWLPDPVEWYFRPRPGRDNFSLFPWTGFLFAGAIVGVLLNDLIDRARNSTSTFRLQVWLLAASVLLGLAAHGASFLPSIYPQSSYWTTSPAFFFLKLAVVAGLLPLAYAWEHAPWRGIISRWSPVEEMGRSSLFVYWVHVELVYGVVSQPLRRALRFELVVLADVLFTVFVLALVLLKNRIVTVRRGAPYPPQALASPLSD